MNEILDKKCLICGSVSFNRLDAETCFKKLDQVAGQFIIQCGQCGIVTRSPSLFSDEFNDAASVDVRNDEHFIGGETNSVAPHIKDRFDQAASSVNGKSLLDIGCGSGALLVYAAEQGWDVYGTEQEPSSIEKLSALGIRCSTGDLEGSELSEKRFDLVHMNHVLEHVDDPLKVLRTIGRLLKDDGLAVVEVPNEFDALTQRLRQTLNLDGSSTTTYFQHEWFFSPKTLRNVCGLAGLRIEKLSTPFRSSGTMLKDIIRFPAAAVGSGEVIEVMLRKG